jgi:hypothetical protein
MFFVLKMRISENLSSFMLNYLHIQNED